MRLLVVGGDRRALRMLPLLEADGHEACSIGLCADDERQAQIGQADALLFPYPYAVREGCVPTLSGLTLHPEDVLECTRKGAVLVAGAGLEPYVCTREAMGSRFRLKTYASDEAFMQHNAELSAEAALCEAMQRTDRALSDLCVLVTGYGRFGRALSQRLLVLGAEVWVACRREVQRLQARSDGMHAVAIEEMEAVLGRVDMVLNTIPARVLPLHALQCLRRGAWLLELAGAPYGFDREAAVSLGLCCDVLPALPARYAPQSAAMALKRAAMHLVLEALT